LAALSLANVSKLYQRPEGTVEALVDVTVEAAPGEFIAVQGPSGSGKTTLLLCAGGLLAPDSGTIEVGGRDVYRLDPDHRARFRASNIGFVFQQFHLLPYLNVTDNVLASLLAQPVPEGADRARQLIEQFGLTDRAAHVPAELSTGERQRTALARALLNSPSIILADEPTGNLDEDNTQVVLDALARFAAAGGAVLLATHSRTVAERADRVLFIKNGKVCAD